MKKKASEIKVGDVLTIGGEKIKVVAVEHSDISKQGTKKTRIEAKKQSGEKIVLIRPADYPLDATS